MEGTDGDWIRTEDSGGRVPEGGCTERLFLIYACHIWAHQFREDALSPCLLGLLAVFRKNTFKKCGIFFSKNQLL